MRRPSHSTVIAYLALFFALSGSAYAATGGTLFLGGNNVSGRQTLLSNTGTDPVLGLRTRPGQQPLAVSPGSGKVSYLNADSLDGLDSGQLQRRVSGRCGANEAITGIGSNGSVTCLPVQPAASSSPAPVSSPSSSPTYRDRGFALSGLTTKADPNGNWSALGTITNESTARMSAQFQINVQQGGSGVATLVGSVSQLAAGASASVQFFSQNPYNAGSYQLSFSTTSAYAS